MKKFSSILILIALCLISYPTIAQNTVPSWYENVPQKSGYLYAAAMAKSSDVSMAHKKARTIALTDLSKNYTNHFENIAKTCDTISSNNNIRTVITTMKNEHGATFVNAEEVEKHMDNSGNLIQVYLLIRVEIKDDIKQLQKAISQDKTLNKKSSKARLSEALDKL